MTKARIQAWQGKHILVVGDLMIDQYLWGDSTRISPEAPVPVVDVAKREIRPGGAANAALNLQAMGGIVSLMGLVGTDKQGKQFIQHLQNEGFGTETVFQSEERRTTVKTRIMARGQQLIRVDEEDTFPITATESAFILQQLEQATGIDAVLISDYDKGMLTPSMIEAIVGWANKRSIPITVDPKFKQFYAYQNCTLFKPNLRELNEATGLSLKGSDHGAIREAALKLREEMPHILSLITLGKHGMLAIDEEGNSTHIAARLREVVDVSGAGDTTIAAATLALCAGASLVEAAELANMAAGLACDIAGVAPVSATQLQDLIA
ncbi:MAG: bifunctional heptose 7-phosphate kinase/heptose 1-phosphate adenyltransferase [Bacteroidia bacterium]